MNKIKQFLIIMSISFLSEILNMAISLPIPACIYGLIIMLILLKTKLLDLKDVENIGRFLLKIMPIMFIPAGVGIINSFDILKPILIPIIIITFISTIIVMVTSGKVTEVILKHKFKTLNKDKR